MDASTDSSDLRPHRPSARRPGPRERGFDGAPERQEGVARALAALRTLERMHALPPALQPLLHLAPPERWEAVVSFTDKGAWIGSRPVEQERVHAPGVEEADDEHVREIVRLVDRSESDGRLPFLALTFFRDRLLPRWGGPWTRWDRERQVAVESALQRGWLRGVQVPNPRNPAYPTTAIELEREHAEVREILAAAPAQRSPRPAATGEPTPPGDEDPQIAAAAGAATEEA